MTLIGFTLLRNGVKYDYPFFESLQSLTTLCEKAYVALGNSEDGTENIISKISNLKIIQTIWDEQLRKSGLILSQQTNIALAALRKENKSGWAFYLQADEVIDDKEFEIIRSDLQKAAQQDCDAISFRYLHFWQKYNQLAIAKRWYPHEIRAIRVDSDIISYGDAQSFKNAKKIFYSDAHIFHYGHVREETAYKKKLSDFGRWWHSDDELVRVLAKGAKKDKKEEFIPYWGPHPSFMAKKIQKPAANSQEILVYGNKNEFPWISNHLCKWTLNPKEVVFSDPQHTILLQNLPWFYYPIQLFKFHSRVPHKLKSPQALPWTKRFWAMMKFSEKGFALN